jgi:hypothetical protein
MAFAVDRDLLVLEPGLFREVSWVGQRLVSGTGDASGTALTMTSQDVLFDAASVGDGHVVLVGGRRMKCLIEFRERCSRFRGCVVLRTMRRFR